MTIAVQQALEFAGKLQETAESGKAVDAFTDYSRFYGFKSFIVCSYRRSKSAPEPLAIAKTWPKAWCKRYLERGYYKQDPIQKYGKAHQQEVFNWEDVLSGLQNKSHSHIIFSERSYFGLQHGYTIPLTFPNGDYASVQLGSNTRIDLGPKDKSVLTLASRFLTDILRTEAYGATGPVVEALNANEREVLLWAAHGKTTWETSEILNIAERTVICHMESARRKLGAANPTHTIALALRNGQIVI